MNIAKPLYVACICAATIASSCIARAQETCENPITLSSAVVKMEIGLEQPRVQPFKQLMASGWFHRSKREVVTNAHVAQKFEMNTSTWTKLSFIQQVPDERVVLVPDQEPMYARVLIQDRRRDIAILQLSRPIESATLLSNLAEGTSALRGPLTLIGYGNGQLQYGQAHLHTRRPHIAEFAQLEGHAPFDVVGEKNLDAFSGGSSGGPIVNCRGAVVAVMSSLTGGFTYMPESSNLVKRAAANRFPNVFAVQIEELNNLYFTLKHRGY